MDSIRLTSPIPPSVNHYLAYRVIKNKAMSYCTKEAKEYKKYFSDYVRAQVAEQNWNYEPNKEQHFYVTITAYFPRRDMDANNYFKCLLDAITETQLIWIDDNVVCERVNRIYYDSANPHFDITIEPVEYIGIFDDYDDALLFYSRCNTCTRNKRNCSIKANATIGKIQEEITNKVCNKYTKEKGV